MKNPFEALGLDPLASTFEITERVRELSEDADEPRRKELRALWEELTRHPRARITAAVATFVLGDVESPSPPAQAVLPETPDLRASFLDKLPLSGILPSLSIDAQGRRPLLLLPLPDDPILEEPSR